ncbi:MAG: conjugal transfer pilus assembly protein TraU [Gammaproteobacteria bacterium]|nr:conjugal transfer pilus assembly protein TraU [Gammaproteobacteria bacterium]
MLLIIAITFFVAPALLAKCEGSFVNPITDICWDCLFPISIGNMKIVSSDYPDTDNPGLPISACKINGPPFIRIGLNIGFWEPFALTDVTPTPYCMVNLGGFTMDIGNAGYGGKQTRDPVNSAAFYYVHWYKYPLILWLNIITSLGCLHTGDFDIAYLTELDPLWNDDELGFILNPEAILFGNPVAQAACAADSAKAQFGLPIDKLFWCIGTQGSIYPLTGRVFDEKGPIQAAVLLSERMNFKLHRELLIQDSSPDAGVGFNGPICTQHFAPIMPKSRYRYQMTNFISAADKCYQFGHDVITWEGGKNQPSSGNCFGFMIWKKRNCTFL